MKILHGHVRTNVRVNVDDANATPDEPMGMEYVEGHGYFRDHQDSTLSIDPDGTLYVYGDPHKEAHDSYGRNCWLAVTDEHGTCVFNTAHDEADPKNPDPQLRTPRRS